MKMLWFQEHTLENIVRKILVACYLKNQARGFAKLQHSGLLFLYFNDFKKTMLDIKKRLWKSYMGSIINSWLYMISVYAQN